MSASPYIGLRPFESKHAHLFFGRGRLVAGLIARLRSSRFIAVLGLSGEGKSSLVRAGLIPALKAGYLDWKGPRWDVHWDVTVMRPDIDPLRELAKAVALSDWGKAYLNGRDWTELFEALHDDSAALTRLFIEHPPESRARLLIVVDQFEELFTRAHKRDGLASLHAEMFVDALTDVTTRTDRIYVIATMRSEYIGECAEYTNLAEAITRGTFLVTRMRPNELQDAIEMPAKLYANGIEPELTRLLLERLLDRSQQRKAQLPVLQHALMRMWEDAQTNPDPTGMITRRHYDRLGTETASLDGHLEEVFRGLEPQELKRVAEALFRRITKQTSRNERTGEFEYVRDSASVAEIVRVADPDLDHDAKGAERAEKARKLLTQENIIKVVEEFRKAGRTFLQPLEDDVPTIGPDTVIDIMHEAVINNWRTAKDWAAREGEYARNFQALCERVGRERSSGLLEKAEYDREDAWFRHATLWLGGPPLSAAWAARYKGERKDLDFGLAKNFLQRSQEQLGQRALRTAIESGKIADAHGLLTQGVRLPDVQKWEFGVYYFALVPEEIRAQRGAEAGHRQGPTPGATSQETIKATAFKLEAADLDWAFPQEKLKELRSPAGRFSLQHYAAHGGNCDVLDYLHLRGLELEATTDRGWTPLHRAAINGQLEAVQWLHKRIGDRALHALDNDGDHALNLAIGGTWYSSAKPDPKRIELIEWLLGKTDNINLANTSEGWTPLHWAAQYGGAEIVELLVKRRPDLRVRDKEGRTPLRLAAEFNRIDELKVLIRALASAQLDLDVADNFLRTPLMVAAGNNDERIVSALLEAGANVVAADIDGVTPLLACLRSESRWNPAFKVLDLLLKGGADANDAYELTGQTALHLAIERPDRGWAENDFLVTLLLGQGALVDIEDDKGQTPLALALSKGHVRIAAKLLKGKRANEEPDLRWLIAAAKAGARDLVGQLTDMGLRPDVRDEESGNTALHAAAEANAYSVMEVLAGRPNVNLNVENAAGLTPMRVALVNNSMGAIVVLARRGVRLPHGFELEFNGDHLEVQVQAWTETLAVLKQQMRNATDAQWPFAPIMTGDWTHLAPEDGAAALAPLFADRDFAARIVMERITAVRARPVSFLTEGRLYEALMAHEGAVVGYLTFAVHAKGVTLVDGFPPSDHPPFVAAFDVGTQAAAEDFLRFYCGALAFDEGVLTPIARAGEGMVNVDASPEDRAKVDAAAAPIALTGETSDDGKHFWRGKFVAQYGAELWRVDARVNADASCVLTGAPFESGLPFAWSGFVNGVRRVTRG